MAAGVAEEVTLYGEVSQLRGFAGEEKKKRRQLIVTKGPRVGEGKC